VVGQVLNKAQQQGCAESGDSSQKSDDDDAASELEGAPIHCLNLSHPRLNSPISARGLLFRVDGCPAAEIGDNQKPTPLTRWAFGS
jgi:hypothetical protein